MRRVVVVAPSFAPSSNPPTHRVRFFARHLPSFGWTPEVLSVDPARYEEPADDEIGRLLPEGLAVTRAGALPARWTRPLGVGDIGLRALPHLDRALRRICEMRRPDLLLIPGPPWFTFVLGPRMKRAYGVPYVIDYIDPWVSSWGEHDPWWRKRRWFRQLALWLEPAVVREAAHIVAVSDGTNDGVRARYPDLPADRFTGLPYGFELADFDVLREHPRPNPYWDAGDGRLHLVYVGAMLPKGYETLRALFAAVLRLRDTDRALHDRLRLHFFGTTYDPRPTRGLVEPVAREMGLGDVVREHPARVPYLDALNILCSADAILALGSSERHYTASKIYPCILARRPLLAIYHEASSVCDVVRESRAGRLVTYSDAAPASTRVGEIAEAIRRIAEPDAHDPAAVRWDHFAAYSAERMTERLAAVFDRIVGARERIAA